MDGGKRFDVLPGGFTYGSSRPYGVPTWMAPEGKYLEAQVYVGESTYRHSSVGGIPGSHAHTERTRIYIYATTIYAERASRSPQSLGLAAVSLARQ